jgi:hypothetical protein
MDAAEVGTVSASRKKWPGAQALRATMILPEA